MHYKIKLVEREDNEEIGHYSSRILPLLHDYILFEEKEYQVVKIIHNAETEEVIIITS